MKKCTSCQEDLPESSFSPQKTNPSKLYAWCDNCRASAVPYIKPFNKGGIKQEYDELRAKAVELRKFSPDEDRRIQERYRAGEKVKDLASEFKVSKTAVYGAIHRRS
jgi:hypothetical protein